MFNPEGQTTLSREFEKEVGGTNLPFADRKFDGKIIHIVMVKKNYRTLCLSGKSTISR